MNTMDRMIAVASFYLDAHIAEELVNSILQVVQGWDEDPVNPIESLCVTAVVHRLTHREAYGWPTPFQLPNELAVSMAFALASEWRRK
jgi:hypothetical protein